MATVSNRPRQVKPLAPVPPPAWQWVHRPIWSCDLIPQGMPGMLVVNNVVYMLIVLSEGPGPERGYRLVKDDGSLYDLPADLGSCDCPDGTYRSERPHGCKHAVALREALRAIGYQVATPTRPAFTAEELAEADRACDKWGTSTATVAPRELVYADDVWPDERWQLSPDAA